MKSDYINELVGKYDILIAKKWNTNKAKLFIEDYDKALSILEEKYPNYKKDIKDYNYSKYGYYTNIFIMKK